VAFVAALALRGGAFAVVLRALVPRAARVPVAPDARRVVARMASGWARGSPLLLSSLLTSGFSLCAVDGFASLRTPPLARPHPQHAKQALERPYGERPATQSRVGDEHRHQRGNLPSTETFQSPWAANTCLTNRESHGRSRNPAIRFLS